MKINVFELCITRPLGFLISIIYDLVQNYGLAIILFTIVVKLILMPLQVKSQRAMKRQQKVQPIIAELQKKYANDQQKLQQEMMKVYRENNISMSGGCLPLLIQMPILIALYSVIRRPLTYIKGIDFMSEAVKENVMLVVSKMKEGFPEVIGNLASTSFEQLRDNYQIQLAKWADMLGVSGGFEWDINFNFLGLDLSGLPSESLPLIMSGNFADIGKVLLILIPALAMFTTWISMKYSQSQTAQNTNSNDDNPAQSMTKSMSLMMPIMSGFFTFTLPPGIGIYWIISSVMQMVQQFILNKYFDRKEDDFVVKLPEKNRKNSKKRR